MVESIDQLLEMCNLDIISHVLIKAMTETLFRCQILIFAMSFSKVLMSFFSKKFWSCDQLYLKAA